MPEPERQLDDDSGIEPVIRPKLGLIQGGGEGGGPSSRDSNLHSINDAEENPEEDEGEPGIGGQADEPEDDPNTPAGRKAIKDKERKAEAKKREEAYSKKQEVQRKADAAKREAKFKKTMGGNSSLKKKMAIAGAAAGGSVIVSIIAFFALLPLKIEHIITNIEKHFGAATSQALENQVDNLYSQYVAKQVLPNFNKASCTGKSTVDSTCVSTGDGKGPVGRLYKSWTETKLESKMATKYNIIIGKKNGQLYLNLDGKNYADGKTMDKELKEVQAGRKSLFTLGEGSGTSKASRNEVRTAIHESLKSATLYDKIYTRFKFGKLLESKYGIKRCLFACKLRDDFNDKIDDLKKGWHAEYINRIITPLGDNEGLILQCLINGDACTNLTNDDGSINPNDPEKSSDFEKNLQENMEKFAAKYDNKALAELVKEADVISNTKNGFSKYILSQAFNKMFGTELTTEAIDHVANPLSLVQDAAKFVNVVNDAGKITKMTYAVSATAAVGASASLVTLVSEVHSGNLSATALGSAAAALSQGGVDATNTPLYNSILGDGSETATSTASGFFPKASADSTVNHTCYDGTAADKQKNGEYTCKSDSPDALDNAKGTSYPCDDGKTPRQGKVVCDEENIGNPQGMAANLSKASSLIPGPLSQASEILTKTTGSNWNPFNWASALGNVVTESLIKATGLDDFMGQFFSKMLGPLMNYFVTLLHLPFSSDTPNGGRLVDEVITGEDVSQNKTAQVTLGGKELKPEEVQSLQQAALTEDKQDFDSQSFFARMFDTDSTYSLVSKLADATPLSLGASYGGVFGFLLSNPLGHFASAFGSLFTPTHAFAAPVAQADPMGIAQHGYSLADLGKLNGQVAADGGYQEYLDKECGGNQISDWVKAQTEDENTGDAVASDTEPCLLVNSAVQSAGGLSDPSLLPAGSQNTGVDGGTGTGAAADFTVGSFNMCQEIDHGPGDDSPCPHASDPGTKRQQVAATILGSNGVGNPAFDIIGGQEVSQPTQDYITSHDTDYKSFPTQVAPNNGKAIFWNTKTFTSQGGGYLTGVVGNGNSNGKANNSFPWVKLQSKSGQTVYVMSLHAPNDSYGGPNDRYNDAEAVLTWEKTKAIGSNLVIITGDFNNGDSTDGNHPGAYCVLTDNGVMQHAKDMAAGANPAKDCPSGHVPIDGIYSSLNVAGVTASGWNHTNDDAGDPQSGSDHSPGWVTYHTVGTAAGGKSVPYDNPVYSGQAQDPAVIRGDDKVYHVYITGKGQLSSTDLVHWKKVAAGWNLNGSPHFDCNWAPDVEKVGSKYVLTWAGINSGHPGNCNKDNVTANGTIEYAVGDSAGGPFKYGGKLTSAGYAIDPHVFVDDDGSTWLEWGGGSLFVSKLKVDGDKLSLQGSTKTIYNKIGNATIENGWIEHKNGWYYLFFSQGDYREGANPQYSTKIARSKAVDGPYTPTSYKDLLTGQGEPFWGPGGGSITTDDAGTDWFVYHDWYKGNRALMIDPITYGSDGWPTINNGHPATTQPQGPVISGAN